MVSTEQELLECKNCGNTFTKDFCNSCGQKNAHRITLHHVMHDVIHVFLHADKGIFAFISRVVTHPGTMAYEYIQGKRKIFNPYQYLIFSVGLVIFLMSRSHFYESLDTFSTTTTGRLPAYFQKALLDFNQFLKNYTNVITFMAMPVYAWAGWFFNRKRRENYAEHFTMIVFSMAQINTLNAIALLVLLLTDTSLMGTVSISIALSILSFCITYKQYYNLRWVTGLWKGILVYATSYLGQLILMGLGLLVYILILKSTYQP